MSVEECENNANTGNADPGNANTGNANTGAEFDANFNRVEKIISGVGCLLLIALLSLLAIASAVSGCAPFRTNKVVDGMNFELGIDIPSTEWSFNFVSYTSGVIAKGNGARIAITNEVTEKNSYFGVVDIWRQAKTKAYVTPGPDSSNSSDSSGADTNRNNATK